MAISKGEAEKKAFKKTRTLSLEKRIDKALVERLEEGDSSPMTFDCREMSPGVIKRIISEYKAKGWKVEHVSDCRDGDYINFK